MTDKNLMVELRAAKIPNIGWVAVHYWFVIHQNNEAERWEVWQLPSQNITSWFHIHKNLLPYAKGVGNGESWLEKKWLNESARQLSDILRGSPQTYPFTKCYHYWPGPNSNTYVQWILTQAKLDHQMIPQGIGKNHLGLVGWRKTAGVREFSTPLFGFRYIQSRAIELHVLHLAISVARKPFKLRTFFYYTR